MGLLISIPAMTIFANKLFKLNEQINGQWFRYLSQLWKLWSRRRQHKCNRIVTHDLYRDEVHHSGLLPFPHEWQYDLPSLNKSENLLIYGVNSSKQNIYIAIKWRPKGVDNRVKASISLRFDDNNSNTYTLEEDSEVEYRPNEYRMGGLGLEINTPFRRKRIKFRGYLSKNDNQLVYVRFRFLWYAVSRVYDFTHDFDDHFMAKEMALSPKSDTSDNRFEDRFEQFGQIKGTFGEELTNERELYFWGSMSKKYLQNKPIHRNIKRFFGYTKDGIGFHLGFVCHQNASEYRFGYLFRKSGHFLKLKKLSLKGTDFTEILDKSLIHFSATFDDKDYNFVIEKHGNSFAKRLLINESEGMCYILDENETQFQESVKTYDFVNSVTNDSSLVLSLREENAKRVDLSGGKGSSLAVLKSLSEDIVKEDYENQFIVPNGVIVTTYAYQRLLRDHKELLQEIQELEESTQLSPKELKTKCDELMNSISAHSLPQVIKQDIKHKLSENFNDFETKQFAVRSSGASEDSEEMSAAGQMSTYLGVRGLEEIYSSVMMCWSSQFSHIAVQYKRGYGQPINSPMAVVIQEMIDCQSAGVMFTCDPMTGDERHLEITANYGLGESVVSASSEPDTIKVSVNIESNSLSTRRRVNGIESKVIGQKKTLIKLSDSGGTVEEEVDDPSNCCVSDDHLIRLADIGLRIHKHYGNARDIEWGLKGGQIFMLQSRPVTNLDNSYTDYEILHELDSSHPTEYEIYSRAHWGENFPGASSWIVLQWFWANKSLFVRRDLLMGKVVIDDYNPFIDTMGVQYNQLMFNLTNGGFDLFSDYPDTKHSKQMILSFFGHTIEDRDVLNCFKERRLNRRKPSFIERFKTIGFVVYSLLFGPKNLMKAKKQLMDDKSYDLVAVLRQLSTVKDTWKGMLDSFHIICDISLKHHGPVSMGSSMKLMILREFLESCLSNNPNLESDYNSLISSCSDVVSAEVPNSLREIAKSIKDKQSFRQLTDEEALQVLVKGNDESSAKFRQFLDIHGHRGYRELDPMYDTWKLNPIPCVQTIKGLLSGNETQLQPKAVKSVDQVVDELKTPLTSVKKLLLKKLVLPWAQRGIGYRELSKYFSVYMNDIWRQGFRLLAQRMAAEGLIPTADHFFYLTVPEVEALCNGDRNSLILSRVRHRRRLYPQMGGYKFEEFIKGPQMRPRNFQKRITPPILSTGMVQMKGTPVSNGTVSARVCVSEDINEAHNIQSGDILITYSTDIGWSPYFPLLSGIITEIGGTVSHGAVIAREYGIPCLIAVEGACSAFKTGDTCVLDTTTQTITKVQ